MVRDQVFDHRLNLVAADVELHERVANVFLGWALVGLLAGCEFRVHHDPMFEIVNADRRSLAKTNGAEMPRDLQLVLVSFFDGGAKLVVSDIHIRLEVGYAFLDPVIHGTARIVRILELVHLRSVCALALQVRAGDVHLRPSHFARIDQALQLEVRVRLDAAGRAYGRHAASQIEPGKTAGVLGIHRHIASRRRIVKVIVHADEARDHAVASEVQYLRRLWRLFACSRNTLDSSACDNQHLVIFRSGTRSIDYADMVQHDQRLVILHVRLRVLRRCLSKGRGTEQKQTNKSH